MAKKVGFDSQYRAGKRRSILGALLCIAGIAALAFFGYTGMKTMRAPADLEDGFSTGVGEAAGIYSAIDVTDYYGVTASSKHSDYVVFTTEDKYMFLAVVRDKHLDQIEQQLDNGQKVRLEGFTEEIPGEVIQYTIEFFEENDSELELDYDNFQQYFGAVVLDTRSAGLTGFLGKAPYKYVFGAGAIMLLGGLYLFVTGRRRAGSYDALGDVERQQYQKEMDDPATAYYPTEKMYLTPNHLIHMEDGFKAVSYSEISRVFVVKHYTNGMKDGANLIIRLTDGKQINCAREKFTTFSKKKSEATLDNLHEIMRRIGEKNPKIELGAPD